MVLDDRSAVAQARLGWILGYLSNAELAIGAFEKAVRLGPESPEVLFSYGETLNRLAQPDRALEWLAKAFQIESYVPPSWEFALGHSHVLKRNYGEAQMRLKAVLDRVPMFMPARVQLARLYAETNQVVEAEDTIAFMRKAAPNYTLASAQRMFPYPQRDEATRLQNALRLAGLTG